MRLPSSSLAETACARKMEFVLLLLFFAHHQHKAAGVKIKLSKNNDHDGLSHGVECSQEGDRISPLKGYR